MQRRRLPVITRTVKRGATSLCQCMVLMYCAKTTSFSEDNPDSIPLNVVQKSNSLALCFENTNQFILGKHNYAVWPRTSLLSGISATTTPESCSVEDPRVTSVVGESLDVWWTGRVLHNCASSVSVNSAKFLIRGEVHPSSGTPCAFEFCNKCTLTILVWDIIISRVWLEVKKPWFDNRCVLFGVLCSRFQVQCG